MIRLGDVIGSRLKEQTTPRTVLAGFPSDEGVRRNHGRPGAALAPQAIREALYRLSPDANNALLRLIELTQDLGDMPVSGDLESDQITLAESIAPWLSAGVVPIILGGGHETAYGHFLAHVNARQNVTILNWDAHPDVRPLKDGKGHSGSPFRQSILHQSGRCRQYIVAGLLEARLVPEHLEFISQSSGAYYRRSDLSLSAIEGIYSGLSGPIMVSFDMDAVDQAFAPGVSAPAAGGMNRDLWLHACRMAGRNPETVSMDLVEVNPQFDTDRRTVLLAAESVFEFITGMSERSDSV